MLIYIYHKSTRYAGFVNKKNKEITLLKKKGGSPLSSVRKESREGFYKPD